MKDDSCVWERRIQDPSRSAKIVGCSSNKWYNKVTWIVTCGLFFLCTFVNIHTVLLLFCKIPSLNR